MKILYLVLIYIFFGAYIQAQTPKGEWIESEVTITFLVNSELYNAGIIAVTCDRQGKLQTAGDFISLKNRSKYPLYYRSSPPDTYTNPHPPKASFKRGTVSNAYFNLSRVSPGGEAIVDVVDYRNREEKDLPTHAVIYVRYFSTNGKKSNANKALTDASDKNSATEALEFQFDDPALKPGTTYAFLNLSCFREKIFYVSEIFKYDSQANPVAVKENLLKQYYDFVQKKQPLPDGYEKTKSNEPNRCTLYLETGDDPLTSDQATEIRNGVVKPLERTGYKVNTVKMKQ